MYRCPKCDSEELRLFVEMVAKMAYDEHGHAAPVLVSDEAEWDDDFQMWCVTCEHTARVEDFLTDDQEVAVGKMDRH